MPGPVTIEVDSVRTTYMPRSVLAVRVTPPKAGQKAWTVSLLTAAGWEVVASPTDETAARALASTILTDASSGDAPAPQYAQVRRP